MHTRCQEQSPQPSRFSRLHALIIGINKYRADDCKDLRGCVNDALSVFKYFTDLGAPPENLFCLLDEKATRKGILDAFQSHLINNPHIQPHDPIVVYFAGYGACMPAPKSWNTSDGTTKLILPHDAGYTPSPRNTGPGRFKKSSMGKKYTYGIPDLTLAFLLYRLSEEKGNNITIILDSCGTCNGSRSHTPIRCWKSSTFPEIPDNLDARLRESMSAIYPLALKDNTTSHQTWGKLMIPGLGTHILLAACEDEEDAQEIPSTTEELIFSGYFTTTLLNELRKCDLDTTSYTTLMRNLLEAHNSYCRAPCTIYQQTFRCSGRTQDRLLFSIRFSASKGKLGLIPTADKYTYRVRAGSAQGITPDTEFRVFWDKMDCTIPPIILIARDVGSVVSQLYTLDPNTPLNIPEDAYVTIVKHGEHSISVRIWVDDRVKQTAPWQEVIENLASLPITWVTLPKDHDIALVPTNRGVKLRAAHSTPGRLVTTHVLKNDLGVNRLTEMLRAVVYFHFELKHQNHSAPVHGQLSMGFWELKKEPGDWGSDIYESVGENIFGDCISTGAVASIHFNTNTLYGLEITNHSEENLYPCVLFYDFEDYSVNHLYAPLDPTAKVLIRAGKSLTFGYGPGGSEFPPLVCETTRPGASKECGAFLLLVFKEWVDLAYLHHFELGAPFGGEFSTTRGGQIDSKKPESDIWDSAVVFVELSEKQYILSE